MKQSIKKIFIITLSFVLLLSFYSCSEINTSNANDTANDGITNRNISISVVEDSLTRTSLSTIVYNPDNYDLVRGSAFFIEEYTENGWHRLPEMVDVVWSSIGFFAVHNSVFEKDLDWFSIILSNGHYRVVVPMSLWGSSISPYAEFTITDDTPVR